MTIPPGLTFDCNHERRRVTITYTGHISLSDLMEISQRMLAAGTWTYSLLFDARDAGTTLTASDASDWASKISQIGPPEDRGPVAVLTNADAVYGMARLFGVAAESIGMRIGAFRDRAEAEAWLASQERS